MGKLKDQMIEEALNTPFEEGDIVLVASKYLDSYSRDPERRKCVTIKKFLPDGKVLVEDDETYRLVENKEVDINVLEKDLKRVGINPFPKDNWRDKIRNTGLSFGSFYNMLFEKNREIGHLEDWKVNGLPVREANFNPYVIDKDGVKRYYQRDLCWTLEQKRALISSIYEGISCGQILVREHSWKWVEKELMKGNAEAAFNDIVDGKQRLNTLDEFLNDQFTDEFGNFYSDLSEYCQWHFFDNQCFTYCKLTEDATDEDVIKAFLCTNFTGVPQSPEHIEYVREIAKLLK